MGKKIQSKVQEEVSKTQREYYLREQLKAIQKELGETNEQEAEIAEYRKKIADARMPEEAEKEAQRELERLAKLPPAGRRVRRDQDLPRVAGLDAVEHAAPRARSTSPRRAQVLDDDHYGLEKTEGPHPGIPGGAEAEEGSRRGRRRS